jgi:hypothetical protein
LLVTSFEAAERHAFGEVDSNRNALGNGRSDMGKTAAEDRRTGETSRNRERDRRADMLIQGDKDLCKVMIVKFYLSHLADSIYTSSRLTTLVSRHGEGRPLQRFEGIVLPTTFSKDILIACGAPLNLWKGE